MRAPIARPNLLWRGFALGGIGTMTVLSTSDAAWEWWQDSVTDAIPRETVRTALGGTAVIHIMETLLARRWARRAGIDHRGAWVRTTALYGFPELRHLRRAIAAAEAANRS